MFLCTWDRVAMFVEGMINSNHLLNLKHFAEDFMCIIILVPHGNLHYSLLRDEVTKVQRNEKFTQLLTGKLGLLTPKLVLNYHISIV